MKKLGMFDATFVVFVIVNVLAAVALYAAGWRRPFNPTSTEMAKMFLVSVLVSTALFSVIAKATGRKLGQGWK